MVIISCQLLPWERNTSYKEENRGLTGIDSRTLDTSGDAAFPSTKRKKVATPITL